MPLYEHLYTLTMSSAECRICVTTEILTKTFMWSIFSKKNVPSLTTFNRSGAANRQGRASSKIRRGEKKNWNSSMGIDRLTSTAPELSRCRALFVAQKAIVSVLPTGL